MMILKSHSNETKQKSKLSFPDGFLISKKNKENKPLSDAEKSWVDLIEHGKTTEIVPSKTDNKPANDKVKIKG